jgi:hypothetical protein
VHMRSTALFLLQTRRWPPITIGLWIPVDVLDKESRYEEEG